jgi:hypothetical protein
VTCSAKLQNQNENENGISNLKSKSIYCPTLGHSLEYTQFLDEAKRIATELQKAHDGGFVKDAECIDAKRLAVALAVFQGDVDEIFVPIKEEDSRERWKALRASLKG